MLETEQPQIEQDGQVLEGFKNAARVAIEAAFIPAVAVTLFAVGAIEVGRQLLQSKPEEL